jgi:hypothetical protein
LAAGEGLMRKPRPVGVWLILIYLICGVVLANLILYFHKVPPATKAYQEHLTRFDRVAISTSGLVWEVAIIVLFFLRKHAAPLLALAICLHLAVDIRLATTTNWLVLLRKGIYVEAVFYIIDLAILLYAIRLARKGILY